MTRVVKDAEVRRSEILEVAQQLFYSGGYERTSIQDIIDTIGIAKGTFYHYFNSKLALLDALIERMFAQTLAVVQPIVADDQLTALEKFERLFTTVAGWKLERKDFFLDILRTWYDDDNAIFRHKLKVASHTGLEPLLTIIIRQGIEEGVFAADYPDHLAEIVLLIGQSLSETLGELLLKIDEAGYDPVFIAGKVTAYQQAIERVLGAPQNSLKIFDLNNIKPWFD